MFGLGFLSPLFLVGMAAAAIPIAIHLFHRRTEPVVEFSAMRFLRRAPVEHSRHRRLREMILLALRVAALLLLAFAFARPYFTESAAALATPATVVMVDTSVSMSAPGQFERARAKASEILRAAAPGSSVAVVAFADGVDVIAPLSEDRAGALTAVSALNIGSGATRYRTALGRAAEVLGTRSGRIVVVTDLQQSGWDTADQGAVPERIPVEVEDIGGPETNLAVAALRIEGTEANAFVHNFSSRPVTTQVNFAIDGKPTGAVAVALAAGGSAEARLALPVAVSGGLSATVSDTQGYAADNTRFALLDEAAAPLVLAVTASGHPSESFYLDRALAIAPGAGGFRFRAVSGPAFSALTSEELDDVRVVVILGTRGLEQRGRELLANYVRSGGGLLLTAGPDVDAMIVREALQTVAQTSWRLREAEPLRFAPADSRHPVFRVFGGVGTLGNVSFSRAALMQAGDSADIVARFSDGSAALIDEQAGEGRVLVFGSDLNNAWNNFPVQPAFVPFVHETLRHLASARPLSTEYLVGALPGAEGRNPGVVDLVGRRVVVNIDPRESDPSRTSVDQFKASVSRVAAGAERQAGAESQQREDGQRLWQYALLLMVVSLAAEGMLGRRLG
jgi:Aerotolerance regulator N-terminal/von Willebrand factor type A domain